MKRAPTSASPSYVAVISPRPTFSRAHAPVADAACAAVAAYDPTMPYAVPHSALTHEEARIQISYSIMDLTAVPQSVRWIIATVRTGLGIDAVRAYVNDVRFCSLQEKMPLYVPIPMDVCWNMSRFIQDEFHLCTAMFTGGKTVDRKRPSSSMLEEFEKRGDAAAPLARTCAVVFALQCAHRVNVTSSPHEFLFGLDMQCGTIQHARHLYVVLSALVQICNCQPYHYRATTEDDAAAAAAAAVTVASESDAPPQSVVARRAASSTTTARV